jgi:hypothetical protein
MRRKHRLFMQGLFHKFLQAEELWLSQRVEKFWDVLGERIRVLTGGESWGHHLPLWTGES